MILKLISLRTISGTSRRTGEPFRFGTCYATSDTFRPRGWTGVYCVSWNVNGEDLDDLVRRLTAEPNGFAADFVFDPSGRFLGYEEI